MIFVVKTIEQLENAIRANADEVVIVGRQAPEIMKTLEQSDAEEMNYGIYPIFSKLNKNFEVLKLIDNSQTMEGCLLRNRAISYY